MKKAIALWGAAIATLLGVAAPALSSYESIHKVEEGGKTKVYFPGTPGTQTTFKADAAPSLRVFSVNRCGWIQIKEGLTVKVTKVTGTNITSDAISGAISYIRSPICEWTGTEWYENTQDKNHPFGKGWRHGSDIWIRVLPLIDPNTGNPYQAQVTYRREYKVNIKECGFGYATISTTKPMTSFVIGTTTYNLSSLPSTSRPMICKLSGNQKQKFIPAEGF